MPRKTPAPPPEPSSHLFRLDDFISSKPGDGFNLKGNVWTTQKAQLISRYLYSFLAVTRNGIYIDAFAGPQDVESRDHSWSAKQVLSKKSKYLSRACLFEQDPAKIPFLNELHKEYCEGWTRLWRRQVVVTEGDCNVEIPAYLNKHRIKPRRPAFALLDQWTHECKWDLVKTLATHKQSGNKIEIFYFLAQGWMNRSVKSATTDEKFEEIENWFGGGDYWAFIDMTSWQRAAFMEKRFTSELGYRFAKAFPMRERGNSGNILFWLIHASDHPRANPLMVAAFNSLGLSLPLESWEQVDFENYLKLFDDPA